MNPSLVFDVGGTLTRAALYDPRESRLLVDDRRLTPNCFNDPGATPAELVDRLLDVMLDQASKLTGAALPARIGVAFAGPVSEGIVLRAPTIWGDRMDGRTPLRDLLIARFQGCVPYVCNDMTAAGYRYLRTPTDDFCIVTVSSGIGHKLFVNGRPAVGPHGRGGEIGHLRIDDSPAAPLCECGGRGHLATLTCGRATSYQVHRSLQRGDFTPADAAAFLSASHEVDNRALAAAFRAGDAAAGRVIEAMAAPLGRALGMLHLATGFERVVVIGGFGLALGDRYLDLLAAGAAASGWDTGLAWRGVFEFGEPDDNAVLMGLGRALAMAPGDTAG